MRQTLLSLPKLNINCASITEYFALFLNAKMATQNRYLCLMLWNAMGIMSSSSYLCKTLSWKEIDMCGISEHWLYERNLNIFEQVDNNHHCHAVSDFSLCFICLGLRCKESVRLCMAWWFVLQTL